MRIRILSLWRQIIFLPRHGARYMYWQQSGPFCLRKPGLEMYLSLWIIWFLYWWGFSQHGLKNGILHGWQEARENSIFSCAFTDFFFYHFSRFLILCTDRDIHLQLRFCPWRAHHDRTMIFQLIKFLDIIYESTLIVYRNYIEEMNSIKRRILAQSWLFKAKKQWRYHCFLYSLGLMPSTLWNALLK